MFGLHLVVLGWLVARSHYMPRWLGWLLMADGAAWVVNDVGFYVLPNASFGYLSVLFAGELVLMVWLLGWGWRLKEPGGNGIG